MGSPSATDAELHTRIRQQEVVAELGQQALESEDLDRLMHDASAAVADTLDTERCRVLELLPGEDEAFTRASAGRMGSSATRRCPRIGTRRRAIRSARRGRPSSTTFAPTIAFRTPIC